MCFIINYINSNSENYTLMYYVYFKYIVIAKFENIKLNEMMSKNT